MIILFISNIILARLLSPSDFGLIGLLTIFVSLANVISESGFNSALIQRKDIEDIDYNTVFYWNISVSVILIIILYFSAPSLGEYFGRDELCPTLRVMSIIMLINSLCTVQITRLMKLLRFKILALRTICAALISSVIGILLAWYGFGVWALVWQSIFSSLIGAILLWSCSGWTPALQYSWGSFRKMFKFGAYIFISSISNTLYENLQSFIIGKSFSIRDLGFYTQAKKIETVPVEGTSSVLNAVLFPVYSSIAHDRERHINMVRKNINIITYITFPLMLLLIVIAPDLFRILFTSKWDESIPMFQILCVFGMFTPLNIANTQIFRAIGEGKVFLILQTLKRLVGVMMILAFIQFGLYAMLWSIAGFGILSYGLNLIFTDKVFGYSFKLQFKDILPNLVISLMVFILCILLMKSLNLNNNWIGASIGIIVFLCSYLLFSYIFKLKSLNLIITLIKERRK